MIKFSQDMQDSLTKGGNESWLKQVYDEKVMNTNDKYAFVCVNIKRFQYILYEYGKESANEVVKILYDVLLKHINDDEYIARIYEDNFNLLLTYNTIKSLEKAFLYPLIDDIFEYPHPIIYQNLYLSFGINFINDQYDFYTAQNRADISRTLCVHTKNRTFSYDYFNPDIERMFLHINHTADKVTKARFNNEFIPYIQPKIDVKSKKIVGGEVLLRWLDKDGKEIPLSEFLPVLNRFGDIYMVDIKIFEIVCSFMHECLQTNKKITPLSFNITNTSLFDDSFIDDYTTILNKYQIPEDMIEFEFMENIQYSNYDEVNKIISTFRKNGFQCALDDFGSGYSSFNILLNSQIDIVKLDRVFFNKELDEQNKIIIQNIVNICKKLNVKVIAEGIEDKKYVDFLEAIDCDMIQGFYFYKPMPLQDFQQLLETKE